VYFSYFNSGGPAGDGVDLLQADSVPNITRPMIIGATFVRFMAHPHGVEKWGRLTVRETLALSRKIPAMPAPVLSSV
jgi:hypothetical protein